MTEKAPTVNGLATRFCQAFDAYQIDYAMHRLSGWNGGMTTAPASVVKTHDAQAEALNDLYQAVMQQDRPNYTRAAQELIESRSQKRKPS